MSAASGQPPMGLKVTPQRAVTVPSMHLPNWPTQGFLLIVECACQALGKRSGPSLPMSYAVAVYLHKGGMRLACICST